MRTLLKVAVLAAAITLAALPALAPAVAFAQAATTAPTTVVDFNPLASALTGALADIVLALGGVLALWLSLELKKKWGIDTTAAVKSIEANDRDALHSAVTTYTQGAIAKFGPNLKIDVGSPAAAYILNGVAKSAPDAIANLKPSEDWIINKAAAVASVTPVWLPSEMASTTAPATP